MTAKDASKIFYGPWVSGKSHPNQQPAPSQPQWGDGAPGGGFSHPQQQGAWGGQWQQQPPPPLQQSDFCTPQPPQGGFPHQEFPPTPQFVPASQRLLVPAQDFAHQQQLLAMQQQREGAWGGQWQQQPPPPHQQLSGFYVRQPPQAGFPHQQFPPTSQFVPASQRLLVPAQDFAHQQQLLTIQQQREGAWGGQWQQQPPPPHQHLSGFYAPQPPQGGFPHQEFSPTPQFVPASQRLLVPAQDFAHQQQQLTMQQRRDEFFPNENFLRRLLRCIQEINQHLHTALLVAPPNNPHILMMCSLLEMTMQLRITQNHQNVIALLQKTLESMLEGMNPPPSDPKLEDSFRTNCISILLTIKSPSCLGSDLARHHVTRILLSAREDIKYNPECLFSLIVMPIVDMKVLDKYLAKKIKSGLNLKALSCSIQLVGDTGPLVPHEKYLANTKETLYRLAANAWQLPDSSAQLLEPFRVTHDVDIQLLSGNTMIPWLGGGGGIGELDRAPGAPTPMMHMMGASANLEDPPGLFEKDKEAILHFEEAMENGYVECTMTTCAVTGAAGSGKSHTMYLALNEDPPDVRQSTGLVEPVRALSTVVGASSSESGSLEWSRVDEDKLLGIVAGATSVANAKEQPEVQTAVQTSPSPPAHSTSLESLDTSLPPATSHDMPTQEQPERTDISGTSLALATPTPQDRHTQEQPESSSEADIYTSEQVSKSEQASHTEVVDELLVKLAGLLKKPVGKRRVTKLEFLYFLDSGGQPQFHELLPSFIPNLSTILFVLKLSEKLSQCPVIEYYKKGKSLCSYQSPYSHVQILKHCIRALQPEKRSTESGSSPHIAVLGTHKDLESLCEEETREEKNQQLLDLLQPRFGDRLIFYDRLKELIYPVNARNPSQEDRAVAGDLREATIRSSAPKPVQIPLPWFMLEQLLRKVAKERGTGIMHIDECRKTASSLHIKPSAFDAALKYLVSLFVFLYYPTVLPDAVFCVPQVFLDKINELVQCRHILCGSSSTLPGSAESTNTRGLSGGRWLRFQNYGVFQEKLLHDRAFSRHYDKDLFTPADFLKLLESLLIVGKVNTTDIHTEYVMPSLLFELESDKLDKHRCNPQSSPAAPLLVHFPGEWPTSGVFCSLVSSLLSTQDWEVMTDSRNKPTCLYRNCFQFEHPRMPGSITLIDSFDRGYFEVHVNAPLEECRKYCPEIQRSVLAALPPKAPAQTEVAFFCPHTHRPSSLHLAYMKPSCHYWHCTESRGKIYGSLSTAPAMMVWGITQNSASEGSDRGYQNPTVDDQQSQNADVVIRPTLPELLKFPCKERCINVPEEIGSEYTSFGILLLEDDNGSRIRDIANKHRDDGKKIAIEILQEWLVGKGRQPVTWQTLVEVLKDAGFSELAKDIKLIKC